ncbi:MAG: NAD-dependent succinate-semialdehyde dehydrogenase [Rugosibacter sp.]|nr:NAD-dependent succinate-semialdehyde dehydrogenase [Rugosibacter sp.]
MQLKRPDLLRQQAYVAGHWCDADSGARAPVSNPATGATLAYVPLLGVAEARRAIFAARDAQKLWAAKTAKERAAVLRRWFELLLAHQDDLARILTAEQGKPLAEARGEIAYGASFIEWFADEGRRIYGETIPPHANDKRILVIRQPIGVAAAITPWNFPNAMIARKVGPALAAGCAMVLKPALQTPLSALALAVLGEEAGLPAGLFSVLTGDGPTIGGEFTANPIVAKLSFTGSTAVGRLLMRQCAETIKKLSLELGGNAPFIVFDDADLDSAVAGALAAKFRNAGQTCVCANRLFVHEKVYDDFAGRFAARVAALSVGDGMTAGVQQGPLIDAAALTKVEAHVADVLAHGGQALVGGARHALGGTFYQPTVLTDVTPEMKIFREETFGPVAPLIRFRDETEVIELANRTEFGLASYFYSRDIGRVLRVAEALEYGMVGVNTGLISTAEAPFGGVKQSGLGREGSRHGIEEYLEMKYICLGDINC